MKNENDMINKYLCQLKETGGRDWAIDYYKQ